MHSLLPLFSSFAPLDPLLTISAIHMNVHRTKSVSGGTTRVSWVSMTPTIVVTKPSRWATIYPPCLWERTAPLWPSPPRATGPAFSSTTVGFCFFAVRFVSCAIFEPDLPAFSSTPVRFVFSRCGLVVPYENRPRVLLDSGTVFILGNTMVVTHNDGKTTRSRSGFASTR